MKIIITGASGFVGTNLSSYLLSSGYKVHSIALRNPKWIETFPNDGDALIHLAGKAHDTTNTSKEEEYFQVNRNLTVELFDKFLCSDIRDFFYFSSVKAVADTVEGILDEDADETPLTPYGKSKLAAEKYLLEHPLPSTKRLFIIRPSMIHGPGNKGNLNLLFKIVYAGIPWPLAAFDNRRSFLSIDNLNYLVDKMINNCEIKSGVYNFADDDYVSTNDLVALISDVLQRRHLSFKVPIWLMKFVAKIGDVIPFPLSSERLKKMTESYRVSNHKIKNSLRIVNLPLSTKEGLRGTIKALNENRFK